MFAVWNLLLAILISMKQPVSQTYTSSRQLSWFEAYRAFLMSKDESFLLKIAPLILLVGSPEVIASNLIPVIGEFMDLGTFSIAALVFVRTMLAVRKYR